MKIVGFPSVGDGKSYFIEEKKGGTIRTLLDNRQR
jgi:hypothetical protein